MKIVHLCLSCFYIDNYSYQENILPKYHVKMGYDVTVIASLVSFDRDGKPCLLERESQYYDKNGYKVIRIDYKGRILKTLNRYIRRYNSVYNQIKNESPDIIFMHGIAFGDVVQVRRYIKNNPSVRLYADSHADNVNSGNHLLSKHFLIPVVWRNCARIIEPYVIKCFGVTPGRCDYLWEKYRFPKEKTELLVMGVDDDQIPLNRQEVRRIERTKLCLANNDFVIVTGGKIDSKKNIHLLIQAIHEIGIEKLHLIVFGNILPEFKESLDLLMKWDRIHYVGWANTESIINYMVASDLACFPGTHSILWEQAVGLSLPAIFKRWEGMTHVDVNGNCIFVKGDDIVELKDTIISVMDKTIHHELLLKAVEASSKFKYSEISKKAIGL